MHSSPKIKLWLSLGALTAGFVFIGLLLSYFQRQRAGGDGTNPFLLAMNSGRTYYEKGEAAKAVELFQKAVTLSPTHLDARVNLANALLLANQAEPALAQAREALALDPNDAAAHYLAGCACLRLRNATNALQYLQTAKNFDTTINPVTFQIGRAHQELAQWEDAAAAFQEVLQFEEGHPAASYLLGQALLRAGRREEADAALQRFQQLMAGKPPASSDPATFERCLYTQIRAPFVLEQPDADGIQVTFTDVTASVFADSGGVRFRGPVGVIDYNHDGQNGLFVLEPGTGFRPLLNSNGVFRATGQPLPAVAGNDYSTCLVGDLQNDRFEDVIVLGSKGSHLFRFATNAQALDSTVFSKLDQLPAIDGALVDLDFTGKLDLLALQPGGGAIKVWRNLGGLYFKDISATSGVPASVAQTTSITLDDLNNDDLPDLILARGNEAPQLYAKQRGGTLAKTNSPPAWTAAVSTAVGDLNNDLRNDVVTVSGRGIQCHLTGADTPIAIADAGGDIRRVVLLDYDNDGWLDLFALGKTLRVWRNLGALGFRESTSKLNLPATSPAPVRAIESLDFDRDGDTDLIVDLGESGLRALRNEGGNAHQQVKLRLIGNRSNASGLGIRIELSAGSWRTTRTVTRLPIEIGVGNRPQIESITARWFDLALSSVDVKVDPANPLPLMELQLPTGSCPYLFAWDGRQFRFVTDLLGASPLGLPVAEGRLIEADPDEIVWLGNTRHFKPRTNHYTVQITEELREVLYLDAASMLVADYPEGAEVHSTSKLMPGKPFPKHELVALHNRRPLRRAELDAGIDVTAALNETDGNKVSPPKPRLPQLRGLAEPFAVTLDFGAIEAGRPWVLALTGWLRFGGGMANIAASHDASLPFPFPILEAEEAAGAWRRLDIMPGAPAGKTKTILVDLAGKLGPGTKRLRLTTAFEIHWDRIALLERAPESTARVVRLNPASANLHWRGFSHFQDLPWTEPLTPDYGRVSRNANWRITPMGWCTRYGDVNELITERDNRLALLNGGDELTVTFDSAALPPLPAGMRRDFFLATTGWDKDADFHVRLGWQVGPLPWLGMDDQAYGSEPRPRFGNDDWIRRYNNRWVGPLTLRKQGHGAKTQ